MQCGPLQTFRHLLQLHVVMPHRSCGIPTHTGTLVCDGTPSKTISCPAGSAVFPIAAAFGRGGGYDDLCPWPWANTCVMGDVLSLYTGPCRGKQTCSIGTPGVPDPCPNVLKYVNVQWACVPGVFV